MDTETTYTYITLTRLHCVTSVRVFSGGVNIRHINTGIPISLTGNKCPITIIVDVCYVINATNVLNDLRCTAVSVN